MVDGTESGFKSPEEEGTAEQSEVGGGVDAEMELSESEKAVDVAWRAEGLEKIMQEKGDRRDLLLKIYVMTIFTESMPGKKADERLLSQLSTATEALCEEYDYDSGKRKYAKE